MLTASQDIDSFIERQRSKLNKQPSRPQNNRPPPPQQLQQQQQQPSRPQDRLDFKVARILDEPPPRLPPQQSYYSPPSPPPPPPQPPQNNYSMMDQQEAYYPEQQQRRYSDEDIKNTNNSTFFNKFGAYDDKRSQLKDDLKREYNEYLQAKKGVPKSKSTSQLAPSHAGNANRRVQFQQPNGKVVAPWEKNDKNKTVKSVQSVNNIPSSSITNDYSNNRSRSHDEQYIQDRELYINELHSQIRELETRKRQLEIESSRLSAGPSSNVARAHYAEDLSALNSLLAERLDQRNAVDHELAHILNRPPLSSSPTHMSSSGISNLNLPLNGHSNQVPMQMQNHGRQTQPQRNDRRAKPNEDGFQIGQETDKESEQMQKKRYQQELQAQMREAQMRKAQEKQAKDEYDRKLDEEIQRYHYFGRSGGGAPMKDKDGNVVANLADLRNPPQPQQIQQQQQQYYPPPGSNDKVYSLGNGLSSVTDAPYYNGQPDRPPYPANSDRSGSPNHARGAASNGLFGTAKTEEQFAREEKYKLDLKRQIDEKRQRDADEVARRRAEEERELAKHLQWQQEMDRQMAEEAARKQEKDAQDRVQQQKMQEELERQRKQEELAMKRKPRRPEKPMTPQRNDDDQNDEPMNRRQNYDEPSYHQQEQQQPTEPAFRSSSPPIPALKNKGKKNKPKTNPIRKNSFDDVAQQESPPPPPPPSHHHLHEEFQNDDDFVAMPPIDDTVSQGPQTYRKPPTPRQPEITSARKRPPPQAHRTRPQSNTNTGMPMRANSTTSLRSDGSDSEVLNRLEHLKRQLKDKEARLQDHVKNHQAKLNAEEATQRKSSPAFLLNAARVHHHRDSPRNTTDRVHHILEADDDIDFKPSYFRDDAILMKGTGGKRIDSGKLMFKTNTEKEANRRRYGDHETSKYFDQEDPTSIANYELNRIAEQNEQRLKKLRDLENDDASLLDSNEVLERFQQKQRLQRGGSQTTMQDDAWFK